MHRTQAITTTTHSILEDFKTLGVHLEGRHTLHYLLQQNVELVIVTFDQQLKQKKGQVGEACYKTLPYVLPCYSYLIFLSFSLHLFLLYCYH